MDETNGRQSRLVGFFDTLGNLFALNIAYVLSCLPIITIGASTAALYSVALKMVKKEEGAIFRSFFEAFKENFKKATMAWLLEMIVIVVLVVEYIFICNAQGTIATVYTALFIVESIVVALILPFLYALIARYENTLQNTIKNSLLLSISNFSSWLKIFLAWFAPVFLTIWYPAVFMLSWFLWLIIGFALIAYGTSHTMHKVFRRIEEKQSPSKQNS